MLGRLKFDLTELVDEMLDQLPEEIFKSKTTTFLDPCMGGGQFVLGVETRLRKYGHSDANIAARVCGVAPHVLQCNYAVNKYNLVGHYYVHPNYLEYNEKMKFDVVIGNPPYTKGTELLYVKFFRKALEIGNEVHFVMPVDLDSQYDSLKKHNQRVKKHYTFISENMSHHFNVALKNIHYVSAARSTENIVVKHNTNPLDSIKTLLPTRTRLAPIKGDTKVSCAKEVDAGEDIIRAIHKDDKIVTRTIDRDIVAKSSKWSNSPYLVFINHTPSRGHFNCAVTKNLNMTWSMSVFAFEVKTKKEGLELKQWLQGDKIKATVNKMLAAKKSYAVTLEMMKRLPTYK